MNWGVRPSVVGATGMSPERSEKTLLSLVLLFPKDRKLLQDENVSRPNQSQSGGTVHSK